jgi:tetratricopeptide (TPR) repeat protein
MKIFLSILLNVLLVTSASVSIAQVSACDQLAGSPFDKEKKTEGVSFGKLNAAQAIQACKQAVQTTPLIGRLWFQYGRALEKGGDLSEAIRAYQKASELSHAAAFNNLGEVFFEEEQYNDAISYYNLALQHGYNAYTFYNLGLAQYFYNQDYVQVIKDMDSALSLDNTIIDAYYNRGLCYSHLKNYEKALSDFNTTLKMSENHENALINRGIVFANLKQFDNSCKDFKKAHSLGSTLAKPYMDKVCNK